MFLCEKICSKICSKLCNGRNMNMKYGFVSREKHRFELLEVDQQYQHFLTPLSDFRLCEPILDNSVRFWTEVFDFGPKYPILGTIVRLWTLASGYQHKRPISNTSVRF